MTVYAALEICYLFAHRDSSSTHLYPSTNHWQSTLPLQWNPHQMLSLHCPQSLHQKTLTRLTRKRSVVVYSLLVYIMVLYIYMCLCEQ